MSKNTNTQPADSANTGSGELRGGTQGNAAPNVTSVGSVTGTPGGTNALTPVGGARPAGRVPEPPTGDKAAAEREDPHRSVQDERTRPSPDVAAQRARDEVEVSGSRSGIDEGNPRQIPEHAPAADGRTGND